MMNGLGAAYSKAHLAGLAQVEHAFRHRAFRAGLRELALERPEAVDIAADFIDGSGLLGRQVGFARGARGRSGQDGQEAVYGQRREALAEARWSL